MILWQGGGRIFFFKKQIFKAYLRMRCDCGRNRLCSRKNGIRRSLRYDIRTGGNGAAPFFGSSFQVESDACIIRFFISENSRMIRKLQ